MRKRFVYLLFVLSFAACTQNEKKTTSSPAEILYSKYCKNCHGSEGNLGLSGASNLMISQISKEETKEIIKNGQGMMQAFNELLDDEQIELLTQYTMRLRKDN